MISVNEALGRAITHAAVGMGMICHNADPETVKAIRAQFDAAVSWLEYLSELTQSEVGL